MKKDRKETYQNRKYIEQRKEEENKSRNHKSHKNKNKNIQESVG